MTLKTKIYVYSSEDIINAVANLLRNSNLDLNNLPEMEIRVIKTDQFGNEYLLIIDII